MNSLDITIIIVGWNSKEYLLKCLQSLFKEKINYTTEIIFVDNGSSDGSIEAVRDEFKFVKIIENSKNLGFARANNLGINQSSGRYLCLINPDIIILPGCINRIISYMDNHPSVGILGPKVLNPDMTLQISWRKLPSLFNCFCRAFALDSILLRLKGLKKLQNHKIRQTEVLSGCFWMVKREALQEVGYLDETFFIYAEDIDWCKRFKEREWNVVYFPKSQAIHHGGTSSKHAPITSYLQMQKANLQYWRKHHGTYSQAMYFIILYLHHMLRVSVYWLLLLIIPKERKEMVHKLKRSWACLRWMTK